MIDRMKARPLWVALAAAAVTALGVGGAALAQSGGGTANQPAAQHQGATKSESSDRSGTKDRADGPEKGEKPDSSSEAPDKGEGADTPDKEAPGNETPNGDGPSGHADEPSNPGADHEAQGAE